MEEVVFDTRNLSRLQKIALMERLWEELSEEDPTLEAPAWHQEVLDSRAGEWGNRETVSRGWNAVKDQLCGVKN